MADGSYVWETITEEEHFLLKRIVSSHKQTTLQGGAGDLVGMGNIILITGVTIILFHYSLSVLWHDHCITMQLQLYYILDTEGSWIKLHIHELHDLYSLLSIIWVNKSRRVHSAFWWENLKERPTYTFTFTQVQWCSYCCKMEQLLKILHMSHLCILQTNNLVHIFHQNFSIHFRVLQWMVILSLLPQKFKWTPKWYC
jgi:hypothetical protein